MPYEVVRAEKFETTLKKFPRELRGWISKVENQLAIDPFTGDPLRVPWLREKKYGKFRIYFLIFEKDKVVSLVGLSDKKEQQETINNVFRFLERYKDEVSEFLNH